MRKGDATCVALFVIGKGKGVRGGTGKSRREGERGCGKKEYELAPSGLRRAQGSSPRASFFPHAVGAPDSDERCRERTGQRKHRPQERIDAVVQTKGP